MSVKAKLLLCAGVFLLLYLGWMAVLIGAVSKSEKPGKSAAKYSDRQRASQGVAYKWAFWSMCGYYFLYMIVCGAAQLVWCDDIVGMFLGVIVGVTVFCVVCIFRDAYFRPDQSRVTTVACINIIGLSQSAIGFMHLSDGTLVENGVLTGDCLQLFFLPMLLVVDAACLLRRRMEKRAAQNEVLQEEKP